MTVSDGTRSCTATLSGENGSCQLTAPEAATYAGDSNYNSSSSADASVTVGLDATTTTITPMTVGPVAGEPIMVSVAVGASVHGSGTPTGTVTVSNDTRQCRATLS